MSEQQTNAPEKVHRYRCPGCGADLLFEPRDGLLACPYCGRQERIEAGEAVAERGYEEYLQLHADRMGTLAPAALEVKCQTCGATVTFTPPLVAGECDFCGSPMVAQPKSADPVLAPEGVLPFRVTQEQAAESIRRWLSSLWFAPNALKRMASQEGVGGVYLPFWTYDAHAASSYTGERGEHYYTTETYTTKDAQGNTVTQTRQVRHTRWHPASGAVSRWFDDLLVPATKSLPPARLAALEPWDLGELTRYEPAYLSGYKAQRYQVELAEGFEAAKRLAAPAIEADVRRDIGGDEQRVANISTHYSGVTFKHLLLPVYVGAYRFSDRVFQLTINGRTGEVQGERPYSFWKIFFFVLFLLALLITLALVFGGNR
jgi:DNA-directed RNA polymerase subunit RPC12/RpoP